MRFSFSKTRYFHKRNCGDFFAAAVRTREAFEVTSPRIRLRPKAGFGGQEGGARETRERGSAFSRHDASEFCETIAPSEDQRARGMPGAQCTRSLVCAGVVLVCTRVFTAEAPETSGIPHAMVLRLISRSPRGPGFLAPVALWIIPQSLTPASGRQDHTTSPSASGAARLASPKRPSHPAPNVRDDRDTPLLVGRDGANTTTDLGFGKSEIFFAQGLDRFSRAGGDLPVGQSHCAQAAHSLATSSLRGATRRSNPLFSSRERWIASRSLPPGRAFARPGGSQ